MGSPTLLLTSTKSGSGKSAIAIGAFLKLKEEGFNPGYFKGIGDSSSITPKNRTDKDVSVITTVVSRKFSKEEICPQFFNPHYFLDEINPKNANEVKKYILDGFHQMKEKTDYMIIEGNHNLHQYHAIGLDDISFAKETNAKVIICTPIDDDSDLNQLLAAYEYCKMKEVQVAGVILSGTNPTSDVRIEKYHIPILKDLNVPFIGGLKNAKQLEKPTIAEVMDAVDGKLIAGDYIKVKNNFINSFAIGAMGADAALSFLRRGKDQCIITGGDRSDIALAAMETSTSLIIFTGNIRPNQKIISKAEEKGIPLILAASDTYTIVERVKKINTHIQPNEIELCRQQVEDNINWQLWPK